MKRRFDCRRLSSLLLLGIAAATLAGGALAADTPKRRTGLWEINMKMDGMPDIGAIQQCIDQSTDNLMQQHEKKARSDCSVMDIMPRGNKVTMHSVCKFGDSTATTDAVFIGSFDTAYKGDINSSFSPPVYGRSTTKMSVDAKGFPPANPARSPVT